LQAQSYRSQVQNLPSKAFLALRKSVKSVESVVFYGGTNRNKAISALLPILLRPSQLRLSPQKSPGFAGDYFSDNGLLERFAWNHSFIPANETVYQNAALLNAG
jgi:hypothetical protein